jgi:hypothetical protein
MNPDNFVIRPEGTGLDDLINHLVAALNNAAVPQDVGHPLTSAIVKAIAEAVMLLPPPF